MMIGLVRQAAASLNPPGGFRAFSAGAALATCLVSAAPTLAGTATEMIHVVDQDANPNGWGGVGGAVFIYEQARSTGWVASPDFVDPVAAVADQSGNLFILDAAADPGGTASPTGAIFKWDTDGHLTSYAAAPFTQNLTDLALHDDGRLFITGVAESSPGGQTEATVFEVDQTGAISIFVQSPGLSEPTGIAIDAAGNLIVVDRSAVPPGSDGVGAVFRVSPGGQIDVVATSPWFADLEDVIVAADGASYLVVDSAADPTDQRLTGAVFQVTPVGAVSVLATSPSFAHLREVAAVADGWLLLDSDAVPAPPGDQPGALFRIAPGGQVSEELTASPRWQTAVGLAVGAPVARRLPGDFDGDGDVDLDDFGSFAACYNGSSRPPAAACPPGVDADLDADADCDLDDFGIFAANYTGSL